jgi:hypothetical protein
VYQTVWLPRQETVASCRDGEEAWSWFPHAAPSEDCRCGLYAARTPLQAALLLAGWRRGRARHAVSAVLGRVSLWGSVVVCEEGWRGERAYPAALYLPMHAQCRSRGQLARLLRKRRSPIRAAEVAHGLAVYGVPVELIACRTVTELAHTLAPDPTLSRQSANR